jgi:hypothetical protein
VKRSAGGVLHDLIFDSMDQRGQQQPYHRRHRWMTRALRFIPEASSRERRERTSGPLGKRERELRAEPHAAIAAVLSVPALHGLHAGKGSRLPRSRNRPGALSRGHHCVITRWCQNPEHKRARFREIREVICHLHPVTQRSTFSGAPPSPPVGAEIHGWQRVDRDRVELGHPSASQLRGGSPPSRQPPMQLGDLDLGGGRAPPPGV